MPIRLIRWRVPAFAALLAVGVAVAAQPDDRPDEPPPPPPEESQVEPGVDVQARGPVHEAYAEPSQARPEPSPLVTKEPPAPIDEVPPDQKPEGDDVVWIPGYWSYDDDTSGFVWVSGFWRVPPPNRQWVPGGWQEVEGGWHWTPGYWGEAGVEQAEYLPAPPPPPDTGPSTPAPDEASDFVPGCWIYRESRYRWRPGFWLAHRPDWCWVPSHYLWTPVGYNFVDGYWDRPLLDRGLLFAPVLFGREVGDLARFHYRPRFVISPDCLLGSLFVRPANCHYYFGDYFEKKYVGHGFVPWLDYRIGKGGFDPNFAYYRQAFAAEPRWGENLRALYEGRLSGEVPRPPRTLVQQTTVINKFTTNRTTNVTVNKTINITNVQNATVLTPLAKVNNLRVTGLASLGLAPGERRTDVRTAGEVVRLTAVTRAEREQFQRGAVAVRTLQKSRVEGEGRLLRESVRTDGPATPTRTLTLERPTDVRFLNAPTRARTPEPAPKAAPPGTRPVERETPLGKAPTPAPRPVEKAPTPAPRPVEKAPTPAPRPVEKPPTPAPRPVEKEPAPAPPRPVEKGTPAQPRPVEKAPPAPQPAPKAPPAPQPAPKAPPPAPRPAPRTPPPPPVIPTHEDRPVPTHEPPKQPRPPAPRPAAPPPHPAPAPAPAPPKKG